MDDRPSYLIMLRLNIELGGLSLIFGDLFHEGLTVFLYHICDGLPRWCQSPTSAYLYRNLSNW